MKQLLSTLMFLTLVLGTSQAFPNTAELSSSLNQSLIGCWEKPLHTLGFQSFQYHFSPTKYSSFLKLNSVYTFDSGQAPDTRSTLVKVDEHQLVIYKFNSMDIDEQDYFEIQDDKLTLKDKSQRILFSMERCRN